MLRLKIIFYKMFFSGKKDAKVVVKSTCPEGFENIFEPSRYCYKFGQVPKNWNSAVQECQSYGNATLVSVSRLEILRYVAYASHKRILPGSRVWAWTSYIRRSGKYLYQRYWGFSA